MATNPTEPHGQIAAIQQDDPSLGTRDAHGLCERFVFTPLVASIRFLEVFRPDVYRATVALARCGDRQRLSPARLASRRRPE
jgi:hypothetical protein